MKTEPLLKGIKKAFISLDEARERETKGGETTFQTLHRKYLHELGEVLLALTSPSGGHLCSRRAAGIGRM